MLVVVFLPIIQEELMDGIRVELQEPEFELLGENFGEIVIKGE